MVKIDDIVDRWKKIGLLESFKDDNIKARNAAELYEKMAEYLINKETPAKFDFETSAFPIICRVIKSDGMWNGPFIPSEIEDVYADFYEKQISSDKSLDACMKTAEHYIKYKRENNPKNGRIPSIC